MRRLYCFLLSIIFVSAASAGDLFSSCRFHFGTEVSKATSNANIMKEVDYLSMWAGSSENYNMESFFTTCKNNGKTPVVISYIIAFTARRDWSLQDCNVDPNNNLCKRGADYLRQQKSRIMNQYAKYARGAAQSYGTGQPIVWCMEPDYSQYSDAGQNNGGLSLAECGRFMNEILDTIKKYCSKSLFSMDISPWKDTTWQKKWFAELKLSRFTFINTSGGQSRADLKFISETWSEALPTWGWVFKTFNTPMFADAGYGTGGSNTGHDSRWDNVSNLSVRINEGVYCVAQANPNSNWGSTISSLRSQLPKPPRCPGPDETGVTVPFIEKNIPLLHPAASSPGRMNIIDLSGRILFSGKISPPDLILHECIAESEKTGAGMYIVDYRNNKDAVRKKIIITERYGRKQ
ncbi:MAG: hypothetical protein JXA18_08290 [Chitinispirillaceae bacterium]|nr:hypothetical protein [Chitinispirillaceae bacterium]